MRTALILVLLLVTSVASAGEPDTVFLTAGGRVRGTVMTDTAEGVTVQLADGTIKRIPRPEVMRVDYATSSTPAPAPGPAVAPPPAGPPQPTAEDLEDQRRDAERERRVAERKRKKEERRLKDEEEVDEAFKVREPVRFAIFLGVGGSYGVEHDFDNNVRTQSIGPEYQLGGGVRKAVSPWSSQRRGLFTLIPTESRDLGYYGSFNASQTSTSSDARGLSIDGTARVHFGGNSKPLYFGLGARCDFLSVDTEMTINQRIGSLPFRTIKRSASEVEIAPLALAELGVTLLDQHLDLSIRVSGGLGFRSSAMIGYAF